MQAHVLSMLSIFVQLPQNKSLSFLDSTYTVDIQHTVQHMHLSDLSYYSAKAKNGQLSGAFTSNPGSTLNAASLLAI